MASGDGERRRRASQIAAWLSARPSVRSVVIQAWGRSWGAAPASREGARVGTRRDQLSRPYPALTCSGARRHGDGATGSDGSERPAARARVGHPTPRGERAASRAAGQSRAASGWLKAECLQGARRHQGSCRSSSAASSARTCQRLFAAPRRRDRGGGGCHQPPSIANMIAGFLHLVGERGVVGWELTERFCSPGWHLRIAPMLGIAGMIVHWPSPRAATAAAALPPTAAAARPPPAAASQVITRLLTFGLNLATARSLTPEAYGVRGRGGGSC